MFMQRRGNPAQETAPRRFGSSPRSFSQDRGDLGSSQEEDAEDEDEMVYEVTVKVSGKKIDVTSGRGRRDRIDRKGDWPQGTTEGGDEIAGEAVPEAKLQSAEAVYELEDGEQELEFYEVQLKSADDEVVETKIKANEEDRQGR